MAFAATLQEAAGFSLKQMVIWWQLGGLTLQTRCAIFTAVLPSFPDNNSDGRPVANWLTVIDAQQKEFADDANTGKVQIEQFQETMKVVFQTCWIGDYLTTQGLISGPQSVALLAAWNAAFGT